jgi:hypothetical protein
LFSVAATKGFAIVGEQAFHQHRLYSPRAMPHRNRHELGEPKRPFYVMCHFVGGMIPYRLADEFSWKRDGYGV